MEPFKTKQDGHILHATKNKIDKIDHTHIIQTLNSLKDILFVARGNDYSVTKYFILLEIPPLQSLRNILIRHTIYLC